MSKKHQLKLVSSTVFLEEASPWRTFLIIISVIVTIFVLLLIWSAFARVNESAKAFGQIVPENKVDIIENFDGGIVEKVMVEDGDFVKKDQVLLVMGNSAANSQLRQLQIRKLNLLLNEIRLQALLTNTPDDKVDWQTAFANIDGISDLEKKKLLAEELETLQKQRVDQQQQIETIQHQLEKYQTDITKYQKQQEAADINLKLFIKELEMYERLVKKGYVSKRAYLAVQRSVATTRAELQAMTSSLAYAESQVKEYQAKLKQQASTFANESQQELDKINMQLAELDHQIRPLQEEVSRHIVKAPIDGEVTGLEVKSGNVIESGEKLLEVVPQTKNIVVSAKLSTTDVGHVNIGDKVKIKVLTYDFSRYGIVDGEVKHIAANSQLTKQGVPFYEVTIKLEKDYVSGNEKYSLKPGMTVEADIITGERTVLNYILNPVRKSFSQALTER